MPICASFFQDMPRGSRIASGGLPAGASSVSELTVLGRPSILVPLPHAFDQDQSANAKGLEKAGGAWPIPQVDLTPTLAKELERFWSAPECLLRPQRVRTQGKPDAVTRLADLVEQIAANKKLETGDGA
jgi:UDP-N-acetylglucosamine--N-acetylmuramyl-(pentapeptide) pyrophosphoryl-undecaprenol N-acetylglucosamine transferase